MNKQRALAKRLSRAIAREDVRAQISIERSIRHTTRKRCVIKNTRNDAQARSGCTQ